MDSLFCDAGKHTPSKPSFKAVEAVTRAMKVLRVVSEEKLGGQVREDEFTVMDEARNKLFAPFTYNSASDRPESGDLAAPLGSAGQLSAKSGSCSAVLQILE